MPIFAGRAPCAALTLLVASGCGNPDELARSRGAADSHEHETEVISVPALPPESLATVVGARVFFGHQSVGENLMSGLGSLAAAEGAAGLRIVKPGEQDTLSSYFMHGRIGVNGDPDGKIDAFEAVMEQWSGPKPDVALMKLCYLDVGPDTDVDRLLGHYRETIERLKVRHPEVVFAYATVPLTTEGRGNKLKRMAYWVLRKDHSNEVANVKRQVFNRKLLAAAGSSPVFDLARVESIRPDGSRVTFDFHGELYHALHPGYTTDGGHLNEAGQRAGASELVRVLSAALGSR